MEETARILVIDPDPNQLAAVSRLLERAGYDVIPAASGEQGVRLAKELATDLILLGSVPPDTNGVELSQRFKADETLAGTAVLHLSDTRIAPETQTQPLEAGTEGYITGPISDLELLTRIDSCLRLRRAEDRRWVSEERYRTVFENAPIGIYRTTPAGQILMANPTLVQMLGYDSFEQLTERSLETQGYHPDYPRSAFKKRIESEGRIRGLEAAWIRQDGSTLFVRENAQVVCDARGETLYYEGTVEDITERKLAEQALVQARREWEEVFQAIGHPTLVLDPEHRILAANRAAIGAAGRSQEHILGKRCYTVFHGADQHPTGCPLGKMVTSGRLETAEMEMEALDGTFLVSCTPVLGEGGQLEKIIHIATDITERKQAEAALQESELKYRTLVETFPDIVLVADHEGRLLFANPALEAQTGLTFEDLQRPRGENPFIHPDDVERVQQRIRDFILSDQHCSGIIENRLIDKQGRLHWYSGIISKITYEGSPAFQVISRDITERKRVEEELSRHRERLEELVEGRTADLRRLVNAMAGREVRMAELKDVIRQLRTQLREAGLEPVANDPLLGEQAEQRSEV